MQAAFEKVYYEQNVAESELGFIYNSENDLYEKTYSGSDLTVQFDNDECE